LYAPDPSRAGCSFLASSVDRGTPRLTIYDSKNKTSAQNPTRALNPQKRVLHPAVTGGSTFRKRPMPTIELLRLSEPHHTPFVLCSPLSQAAAWHFIGTRTTHCRVSWWRVTARFETGSFGRRNPMCFILCANSMLTALALERALLFTRSDAWHCM
jgi:hypothetical protein